MGLGKDYTIFALRPGRVRFTYDEKSKRQYVSVDVCKLPKHCRTNIQQDFGLNPPTVKEIRRVGLQPHMNSIEQSAEEAQRELLYRRSGK